MKFLLDAQLPKKLSLFLIYKGHDSLHTLDLPHKNRSKDSELNTLSIDEKRVLVSKDMDFVESLLISNKPYKLLYVNTGNIHNKQLEELFIVNLKKLVEALENHRFVELTSESIIVHG
jgi:predicted nuclease of predicted toxin-antitoxin system